LIIAFYGIEGGACILLPPEAPIIAPPDNAAKA
jgi:hypothetical protein